MAIVKAKTYQIFIDEDWSGLNQFIREKAYSSIFILVDENTEEYCLPVLIQYVDFDFSKLIIFSGEQFKNIESCELIWSQLISGGADRKSLVINLGGGVIGDIGGFAAATFMRGIDFIQIPTTLLSMVDASVGGKLGVDFKERKNIVGLFKDPEMVWIDTRFLKTLDYRELKSGFAEVIKHALISTEDKWGEILDIEELNDFEDWTSLVHWNVDFKNKIVSEDPYEGSKRKILNFGHSIGHAIESTFIDDQAPLLHGEAVALGMLLESQLSVRLLGLSIEQMKQIDLLITKIYGRRPSFNDKTKSILNFLSSDKKNVGGNNMFVLLNSIGKPRYDMLVTDQEVENLFIGS